MRPVRFLRHTRAANGAFYQSGEIAGFADAEAASLIASGNAEVPTREDLLPIPAEFRKLSAPELIALATRIAEREVKDKLSAIKVVEAEIEAREKAASPPSTDETKNSTGDTKAPGGEMKQPVSETKQPGGDGA